jgi:hypothetical protein
VSICRAMSQPSLLAAGYGCTAKRSGMRVAQFARSFPYRANQLRRRGRKMNSSNEFGIVGLGKIGANLTLQALKANFRVVGHDIHGVPDAVRSAGGVVSDAMHLEVTVPVIAQSVMQLFASRDDDQHWARAIAMMRHEFGGHPFGTDQGIASERREGKVGPFPSAKGDKS